MSSIPLYAFVHGDTLGLVVLAPDGELVAELARRLARAAASRVTPSGRLRVLHRGKLLPGELSLREAGVRALDRVDLVSEDHGV
ncbi:MAG TPA: toluene-4-monooxygenase system B family protein [Polyangiaceae bacterium]